MLPYGNRGPNWIVCFLWAYIIAWQVLSESQTLQICSQSPEERKLPPRVLRTRDGHVYVASNQLQSCTHKWQKHRGHPQGPHPQRPGSFTALPPMLLLLGGRWGRLCLFVSPTSSVIQATVCKNAGFLGVSLPLTPGEPKNISSLPPNLE